MSQFNFTIQHTIDYLDIDSTDNYSLEFVKIIDWRTDFKNLPVYIHECYELKTNEKLNLFSILEEFDILSSKFSGYLIYNYELNNENWIIINVKIITMLGNSQEGIDYEYYFKKN